LPRNQCRFDTRFKCCAYRIDLPACQRGCRLFHLPPMRRCVRSQRLLRYRFIGSTQVNEAAVRYHLNTEVDPPTVTLSYGGLSTTVKLESEPTKNLHNHTHGYRWWFVGSNGKWAMKLYFIPGTGWVTRTSANLVPRCQWVSTRKRRKIARERTIEKLKALYARTPYFQREQYLQGRLEKLQRLLDGDTK
jgi:hypothetical protein